MRDADYYAPGSYNDANAPWNEAHVPECEFDLEVTETVQRIVTVTTDDYNEYIDEEDGHMYTNTEKTDWEKVYEDNGCLSVGILINKMREIVQEYCNELDKSIALNIPSKSDRREIIKKRKYIQSIIKESQGWETVETTFN